MRKGFNLQDELKILYHAISIFKRPLKHAISIHDIRINVQEKVKKRIVKTSFSPELLTWESGELKQREKGKRHEYLHEIITQYKNN